MAAISTIMVLNLRGEILLTRHFRPEEFNKGVITAFRHQVIAAKNIRAPVKSLANLNFAHIRSENIYLVAVTKSNANISLVFEMLHKVLEIFKTYFGGKVDEEAIKNHFILAFELLDEMIDWGLPQGLSFDIIKPFITQKGAVKTEKLTQEKLAKEITKVTGASPWRGPDIKHRRNELYIDVIESVNLLVSVDGKKLRSDVSGQIMIKCALSGMPECKFGLNDKILMEKEARSGLKQKDSGIAIDDFTFHPCVRLTKFDQDRTISFVPPDGTFELMKYRSTENIEPPFTVTPIIKELSRTRLDVKIAVKSNFQREQMGNSVKVIIPLPKNTALCKIFVQAGKAKYTPEQDAIVWRLKRFPGATKFVLSAEVELSSTVLIKKWNRPPISMQFEVPMFTASGLRVRFLKVLEPKLQYQAIKWVRYLTKAGNYQYRI